jgi:hypothetical protein
LNGSDIRSRGRAADRRLVILWIVLVALSLFSVSAVQGFSWFASGRVQAVAVMSLAFIKVRIVVLDFMEVRHAPPALRTVLEVWMAVVWATITWLCVTGPS